MDHTFRNRFSLWKEKSSLCSHPPPPGRLLLYSNFLEQVSVVQGYCFHFTFWHDKFGTSFNCGCFLSWFSQSCYLNDSLSLCVTMNVYCWDNTFKQYLRHATLSRFFFKKKCTILGEFTLSRERWKLTLRVQSEIWLSLNDSKERHNVIHIHHWKQRYKCDLVFSHYIYKDCSESF